MQLTYIFRHVAFGSTMIDELAVKLATEAPRLVCVANVRPFSDDVEVFWGQPQVKHVEQTWTAPEVEEVHLYWPEEFLGVMIP